MKKEITLKGKVKYLKIQSKYGQMKVKLGKSEDRNVFFRGYE